MPCKTSCTDGRDEQTLGGRRVLQYEDSRAQETNEEESTGNAAQGRKLFEKETKRQVLQYEKGDWEAGEELKGRKTRGAPEGSCLWVGGQPKPRGRWQPLGLGGELPCSRTRPPVQETEAAGAPQGAARSLQQNQPPRPEGKKRRSINQTTTLPPSSHSVPLHPCQPSLTCSLSTLSCSFSRVPSFVCRTPCPSLLACQGLSNCHRFPPTQLPHLQLQRGRRPR